MPHVVDSKCQISKSNLTIVSGVLDDIMLPLLPRGPEGGGAESAEAVAVDEDGVEDGALHSRESGAVAAVAASQAEGFFT